jgi:hypothetical protein
MRELPDGSDLQPAEEGGISRFKPAIVLGFLNIFFPAL